MASIIEEEDLTTMINNMIEEQVNAADYTANGHCSSFLKDVPGTNDANEEGVFRMETLILKIPAQKKVWYVSSLILVRHRKSEQRIFWLRLQVRANISRQAGRCNRLV